MQTNIKIISLQVYWQVSTATYINFQTILNILFYSIFDVLYCNADERSVTEKGFGIVYKRVDISCGVLQTIE